MSPLLDAPRSFRAVNLIGAQTLWLIENTILGSAARAASLKPAAVRGQTDRRHGCPVCKVYKA